MMIARTYLTWEGSNLSAAGVLSKYVGVAARGIIPRTAALMKSRLLCVTNAHFPRLLFSSEEHNCVHDILQRYQVLIYHL